ncbi:MAG TPA: hypothetical protein IGS37_17015 [Synechococcales cyanobacterium M55_K2018_004]|nr:hypothetical protein [Synechococcales cyanobacterium M55_K2018_004]
MVVCLRVMPALLAEVVIGAAWVVLKDKAEPTTGSVTLAKDRVGESVQDLPLIAIAPLLNLNRLNQLTSPWPASLAV